MNSNSEFSLADRSCFSVAAQLLSLFTSSSSISIDSSYYFIMNYVLVFVLHCEDSSSNSKILPNTRSARYSSVGHFYLTLTTWFAAKPFRRDVVCRTDVSSQLIIDLFKAENLHFSASGAFARGGFPPFRQGSGTPASSVNACSQLLTSSCAV